MRFSSRNIVCAGLLAAALGSLLPAGCGRSRIAEDIRALRLSGEPDSARAMAVVALTDVPSRMDVWLEFTHAALGTARAREEEANGELPLDYLIQAGLTSGAMWVAQRQDPPRPWRDVGRMVALEVGRRANQLTGILASQTQTADFLKQNSLQQGLTPRDVPDFMDPLYRLRRTVTQYRDESRPLLIEAALLRRLIELLPESSSGNAALLAGQLGDAVANWARTLELETEYTAPVQQQARERLDTALNRAAEDLREFGYFLPKTILDHGVIG